MLFRKEQPELKLQRSEIALTSEVYKFNGTIDCIADDVMVDWKTGECKDEYKPKIYDEWKYQVAAYVYLYNEVNKTNINKAVIVAIAKDKVAYNTYEMDEVDIRGCFNDVFLSCLRIINYQNRQKQLAKEKKKNGKLSDGHEPRESTIKEKVTS